MNITFKRLFLSYFMIAALAIILYLLFPKLSFANEFRVILIPSSESIIYKRTTDNIKNAVDSFSDESIKIDIISLNQFNNSNDSIDSSTNLIVPIGLIAFESAIDKNTSIPILASLISKLDFYGALDQKIKTPATEPGAIFIDQPIDRMLRFTRLALPNNKRLGFLMSSEYRKLLPEFDSKVKGYPHHLIVHDNGNNLISSLNQIMDNSDVIVALPDTHIYNRRNTYNILLSTYRNFIPLIGFSKAYIRAGALAGIYSTPELIGKQTGELISTLSNNSALNRLPRQEARYFQDSVNNRVARSLGLPMLDEILLKQKLLDLESSSE